VVREPPIEQDGAGEVYDSVQGTEGDWPLKQFAKHSDAQRYGSFHDSFHKEFGRQYIVYEKAKAYPKYVVTIRPQ
jgi:hypothetical protein